jgi:hypothetical protein
MDQTVRVGLTNSQALPNFTTARTDPATVEGSKANMSEPAPEFLISAEGDRRASESSTTPTSWTTIRQRCNCSMSI